LAAATPTSSAPIKPGRCVTAIASMSAKPSDARSSASSITGSKVSRCERLAISGTVPPKRLWMSICETTTSDKTVCPSSTTAAAVSSQEVSIPRMRTFSRSTR
jgi:hypothetical protein